MSCPFCNHPRTDGRQEHAWDCDWRTLLQRVGQFEARFDRLERFAIPGGMIPIEDQHGSSKEPDTQRSEHADDAKPYVGVTDHYCQGGQYIYVSCPACNPGKTSANAGAAEPASAQADSAEPGGAEPERAG